MTTDEILNDFQPDSKTFKFLETFDKSGTGQFHELRLFQSANPIFSFGLNFTPNRTVPVSFSLSVTYNRVSRYLPENIGERKRKENWDVFDFFGDFEIWSSFGEKGRGEFLTVFLVSSGGFSRILDDLLVLKYPGLFENATEAQEKHERAFSEIAARGPENTPTSVLRQIQAEKNQSHIKDANPFRVRVEPEEGRTRTYYCPRALLGI